MEEEEVREVWGGQVVESFVGEEGQFEVDALFYGEPVERAEDGCDVVPGPGSYRQIRALLQDYCANFCSHHFCDRVGDLAPSCRAVRRQWELQADDPFSTSDRRQASPVRCVGWLSGITTDTPTTDMAPSRYWFFFLQYLFMSLTTVVTACYRGCNCLPDIKYVNCSSGNFSSPVSNFPYNTEYLDLSRNLLTDLPQGSFGALWALKVLLLKENNITSVADRAFINLQSLQKLDLSKNHLSALGNSFSLGLDSLSELFLANNRLTVLKNQTFHNLDNLVKLDLSANLIKQIQPRALSGMTALRRLHLDGNQLTTLDLHIFSTLHSLEVLGLRGNLIGTAAPGAFAPLSNLARLDLASNQLTRLQFKTLLSIRTSSVHVLLEENPWHCDCDLQRVFKKLASVQRLFLDDYQKLRCSTPDELKGSVMVDVHDELCIAETLTVLVPTVTVVFTVVAAVIMREKSKKGRPAKAGTEESAGLEAYCDN
ncbi:uncharacterized protein ACJ7VT_015184 [Polymixia lowei]